MSTLTVYVFRKKDDIHDRASALETARGLLRRLKMSWTLLHKRLKFGPEFLPTLDVLFRPRPSDALKRGINVPRRI